MANEIVELRRETTKEGLLRFQTLFLYPIDPAIEVNEVKYKDLTPRSSLPAGVETYGLLTGDELTAIDDGDLAFHVEQIEQKEGEALAQVLARIRRLYAKRAGFVDEARVMFEHAGDRYNA